ncbi:hypothetical protein TeGR_g13956 [Tetraparma gracilis]|uniref:Uncharacterized protein n=1 Tax=Tetraparma gracilis TaxID=2962635 RepID=A0ABQ6MUL3_9STRA|nr:hypothetical protein TeGR_g13956 [Tetraparma gracilis]
MSVPLPTKKLLRAKCGAGRWDIEGDGSDWGKELGEVKKWVVASAWDQFAVEAPVSVWKGRVLHTRLSLPLAVGIEDVQRWKRAVETLAGIR